MFRTNARLTFVGLALFYALFAIVAAGSPPQTRSPRHYPRHWLRLALRATGSSR